MPTPRPGILNALNRLLTALAETVELEHRQAQQHFGQLLDAVTTAPAPDPIRERMTDLRRARMRVAGSETERCRAYDGPATDPYGVCQLERRHPGRHIEFRDGQLWAEWSGPFDPLPDLCLASATMCLRHDPPKDGDCPWDGHDHPKCKLLRDHFGFHHWQESDDTRPTMDPHAPKPVTYELPPFPPVGRTVVDRRGYRWRALENGYLEEHARDHDNIRWAELLDSYGPAELAELTPAEFEQERLYGPIGQRWGNPDERCPYGEDRDTDATAWCYLGVGHIGPHTDKDGRELGKDSIVDGPINTDPKRSSEEPCNCGRPDQHRPTCNRYRRVSHRPQRLITASDGITYGPFPEPGNGEPLPQSVIDEIASHRPVEPVDPWRFTEEEVRRDDH